MNQLTERIAETRPDWLGFYSDDPRLLPQATFSRDARLLVAADVWNTIACDSDFAVTMFSVPVVVDLALTAGTWRWSEDGF